MSGLRAAIEDVKAFIISEIPELKNVAVFNNQFDRDDVGLFHGTSFPAVYIEIESPGPYSPLGLGVSAGVLTWRLHIAHQQYNASGSFNMDENLDVYDLRDKLVRKLTGYKPYKSSHFQKINESADYSHKNIYHYVIFFISEFIDFTGSPYDPETTEFIVKDPPIELQIDILGLGIFQANFNNDFNNDFNNGDIDGGVYTNGIDANGNPINNIQQIIIN
jgi:hypothetical protein